MKASEENRDRPVGPVVPPDVPVERMEKLLDRLAQEIVAAGEEGYKIAHIYEWLEGQIRNRQNEQETVDRAKNRVERKADTSTVTLDDIISHDVVLERYPWLSAQILNRWRREQRIRSFRGRDGITVYSRSELESALDAGLRFDDPPEPRVRKAPPPPNQRFVAEADQIRERLFMESLSTKGKRRQPKIARE